MALSASQKVVAARIGLFLNHPQGLEGAAKACACVGYALAWLVRLHIHWKTRFHNNKFKFLNIMYVLVWWTDGRKRE